MDIDTSCFYKGVKLITPPAKHKGDMLKKLLFTCPVFAWITGFLLVLAAFSLAQAVLIRSYTTDSIQLVKKDGVEFNQALANPFFARSDSTKLYEFIFHIQKDDFTPTRWRLVGDDCIYKLEINGVPLERDASKGELCDIHRGIVLHLDEQLQAGDNLVDVVVHDHGGAVGLSIMPLGYGTLMPLFVHYDSSSIRFYIACIMALTALTYCVRFLLRADLDKASICLFLASAVLSLRYFYISNDFAYTNDIDFHLDYIRFVSTNWLRPYDFSPMTSNHPPGYYYIAALWLLANDFLFGYNTHAALRFLSWIFFMVFLIYSLLALRLFALPRTSYLMAAALLLLWPANAHMAAKINSEQMYYAIFAISFYYTLRWYFQGAINHLECAVLFAAISLTIRTNGVVLCLLIATLVVRRLVQRQIFFRDFLAKNWLKLYAVLLICILVCFGKLMITGSTELVHGKNLSYAWLGQFLERLFSFEYSIQSPFNNRAFTQSFWNVLLTSSLFGEYNNWPYSPAASLLKALLAFIVLYAFIPWLYAPRTHWKAMLPCALLMGISIVFLVYFHLLIKDLASQDIRYIYPVVLGFAVFFSKSYELHIERKAWLLSCIGPVLVSSYLLASAYYFSFYAR